ncbi:hypothetical protein E3Q08_01739 [Wallemia mellicola]|nr:hypothetical protein E3Q24_01368 [Wallemia mellicola]TIB87093.1 hypothetical protein E3Q21_01420 [Wallemia mellicola]TIB90181.1 hypothetical protein E3Q20_01407 [Wallemia mellicola]TIC06127.1 hypothetical protein E3Q16_01477 [Wallemia mellicola]TIC23048.1 hypothetical protein E3Q12_02223 [Wallemia mellicola]
MPLEDPQEWENIGNVYYALTTLYKYHWNISSFEPYEIVTSGYSSTMAIYRNYSKLVPTTITNLPENTSNQPFIHIYSADGLHLSTISCTSPPIAVGFSSADELIVVLDDCQYKIYNYSGKIPTASTHRIAINSTGIADARITDDTIVVLTNEMEFYEMTLTSRPTKLSTMEIRDIPSDWTVIPSKYSQTSLTTVIAATEGDIQLSDSLSCMTHPFGTPHAQIKLSPNAKFIALLTPTLQLSIMTSDMARLLTTFDLSTIDSYTPDDIDWCGSNAVAVVYNEPSPHIWLIGPGGEHVLFPYHNATSIKAYSTPSSMLAITPEALDVIQKVPECVQDVLGATSSSPGRMLLSAFEELERGSSKSDDIIRDIGHDLLEAVDRVIGAAVELYTPEIQRRLLKAAQFGWQYLSNYNSDEFIKVASTLRVLNAYRDVGIPLSKAQFDKLEHVALIQLLLPRRKWAMAINISKHLQTPSDVVLVHWANAKIYASDHTIPDEELSVSITERIASVTNTFVGWSDIAKVAYEVGRVSLATKMLDREPRASEVVPQLKRMKEDRLALLKAIQSSDPDLVIDVLLHLRSRLTLGDFFRVLEDGGSVYQLAKSLLVVYAKDKDRDMLRNFYFQDDRRVESAKLDLSEAEQLSGDAKVSKVKSAMKFFSEDKKCAFESKACDEYQKLLTITNGATSVNDAIRELLNKDDIKGAEKLKTDFKVSDKRWWYLRLHHLIEKSDYDGLEELASSKKSPIGYEPFVKALKKAGNKKLAGEYIKKCEPKRREELLKGL